MYDTPGVSYLSEVPINAGLLHDGIRGVSGEARFIDGEGAPGYRAVPYLMVAFTLTLERAARSFQGFHNLRVEALTH